MFWGPAQGLGGVLGAELKCTPAPPSPCLGSYCFISIVFFVFRCLIRLNRVLFLWGRGGGLGWVYFGGGGGGLGTCLTPNNSPFLTGCFITGLWHLLAYGICG